MATPLMHEFAVRGNTHLLAPDAPYDAQRECRHKPAQAYTREPCSCGRELWPPRGRGRGEAVTSPRRLRAKLRALEAMQLRGEGYTWAQIAARLGYATRGGALRAVRRLDDIETAWQNYYARRGKADWYARHLALVRLRAEYRAEHQDGF